MFILDGKINSIWFFQLKHFTLQKAARRCVTQLYCQLSVTDVFPQMFLMLDRHLSATGVALLATKRFYFGVGGGTMELKDLVDAAASVNRTEDGRMPLTLQVMREFVDGSSNIREIVAVRRRQDLR
jgi:hypothetical protein